MKTQVPAIPCYFGDALPDTGEVDETPEDDLWFLPGAIDDEPDDLPPGPRAEPREIKVIDD